MPFKSKAQQAACYAKKAAGGAKGWDCKAWSAITDQKSLPQHAHKQNRKAGRPPKPKGFLNNPYRPPS